MSAGPGPGLRLASSDLPQPDLECDGRRPHRLALCVPSAALALLIFVCAGPVRAVVALAVFPRIFQYLQNVLSHAAAQPHVMAARARGIGPGRILLCHIVPVAAPQVLALAGVSVSMAFGAAVAVEVVCDFPGIGQLAWKAALARDLPLLVALSMLVTQAGRQKSEVRSQKKAGAGLLSSVF